MTGDGNLDVVIGGTVSSTAQLAVMAGDGKGQFTESGKVVLPAPPTLLYASDTDGDFDCDGRADIVVHMNDVTSKGWLDLYTEPLSSSAVAVPIYNGAPLESLAGANLGDSDGKPDLVAIIPRAGSTSVQLITNTSQ